MNRPVRCGSILAVLLGFLGLASTALGQTAASRCLAIAQSAPAAIQVALVPAQAMADEVTIRFVGHSTFLITSPAGVTIATDYNGFAGAGVLPRVVTMNQAHSSHNTPSPDARIEHVLRGWDPAGGRAEHHLQIDDVLIRNVSTDIRGWDTVRIPDGNSIFIFETARLCIGHLGHLHHVLDPADLAWLGQLDIVMAAVDGSYTMDHASMLETLKVVKARLVLPMHYFGQATLSRFLAHLGAEFAVEIHHGPQITVSPATLPKSPKVLVLPGY
jgi:L-ascorbate metabolism protein UlaG (beta-lactamase superfamily)